MERYFPPLKTICSRCKDKLCPLHMLSFAHSELHSLFQFGRGLLALMHACRPYFPRFSKVGWLEPVSHYFLISLLHSLPVRTPDPTGRLAPSLPFNEIPRVPKMETSLFQFHHPLGRFPPLKPPFGATGGDGETTEVRGTGSVDRPGQAPPTDRRADGLPPGLSKLKLV